MEKQYKHLFSNILTNSLSIVLFNPWDKALFLAITNHRPLLTKQNWQRPYQGLNNTILTKTFSGGFYFFFADYYKEKTNNTFLTGVLTGASNAIITNPFSYVRYQSWGHEDKEFNQIFKSMIKKRQFTQMFRGCGTRMSRDITFSTIFINYRDETFFMDFCFATLGTIMSSPFNYLSNKKYARNPNETPIKNIDIVRNLYEETGNNPLKIFRRLQIGWGVLRISLGITFSAQIYDKIKKIID